VCFESAPLMALARAWCVALAGITGRIVGVEADVGPGLPGFGLIGLPDAALNEARERVRAAVQNSGEAWPKQKITVSMSPADLHKRGGGFDLVLALVVLAAAGALPDGALARSVVLGELGLDGSVRGVPGVLPCVAAAGRAGFTSVLVPAANVAEAQLVEGVGVSGVRSLRHALALLRGDVFPDTIDEAPVPAAEPTRTWPAPTLDLADVRGQYEARRALEVAAAGGHHLFLHGSPGTGKTMLAERLPGLLPALRGAAAMEVTEIHSVAGMLPSGSPLVTRPPYCRPHHSATQAALVGGGSRDIRPGAASLAHRGVLFLDEAAEFRCGVLDSLRQPMESGEVVIARSGVTARFPADFLLVLAANPCPCGRATEVGRGDSCACSAHSRRRYLARLSRPLLDRVDVQVVVDRPTRFQLLDGSDGEPSAAVAERVRAARERAACRLAGTPWTLNSQVPSRLLRRELRVNPGAVATVERALDRGALSARGMDRVLRVAWTLADLAGRDRPGTAEVGQALALRSGVAGGWAA
jgi:magnesium chelatase family protein